MIHVSHEHLSSQFGDPILERILHRNSFQSFRYSRCRWSFWHDPSVHFHGWNLEMYERDCHRMGVHPCDGRAIRVEAD